MRKYTDAIFRFIKGMFLGTGFILPGVSGGALAAVFGIYQRMITFVANPVRNFKRDFFFFVPVMFGGLLGVFLLSFALSFLLGQYEMQLLWFFIGCITGTLPTLWKQAGKNGRNMRHIAIAAVICAAVFFLITNITGAQENRTAEMLPPGAWVLVGMLIGLSAVVPGLSSSNFIIFLGLYGLMTEAISSLNIAIIAQIGAGGAGCVLLSAKLMKMLFDRAYTLMYHLIFGLVIVSTAVIVPTGSFSGVIVYSWLPLFFAGALAGLGLGWMEEKYKAD